MFRFHKTNLPSIARRPLLAVAAAVIGFGIVAGQPALAQLAKPFGTSSIWNVAIPSTAKYARVQPAKGLLAGLDTWEPGDAWTVPVYRATTADPLVPIRFNPDAWARVFSGEWKRYGNSPEVEAEIRATSRDQFPFPGNVFSTRSTTSWVLPSSYNELRNPASGPAVFRFDPAMRPASGADGHLAVVQPTGRVLEVYAAIVMSDGSLVALSYSVTDPAGKGDGWQRGQTASMLPSYAGAIDDAEIAGGIPHAIAVTVPAKLLKPAYSYPAYTFDRDAMTNPMPYSGGLPMGSRLAIPRTFDLNKLRLQTSAGRAIALAAKRHGLIIVDRGGSGVTFRVNPTGRSVPMLHEYSWGLQSDLNKIVGIVRPVTFPFSGGS